MIPRKIRRKLTIGTTEYEYCVTGQSDEDSDKVWTNVYVKNLVSGNSFTAETINRGGTSIKPSMVRKLIEANQI